MITVTVKECNTISQNYYDSVVSALQFHQISCSCGHSGCLSIHAYYYRWVKLPDGSSFRIKITRVKCSECGRTHAILLSSIIPYVQISLAIHQVIISAYENGSATDTACTETGSIDEDNVKSIIRKYVRHWQQRLISERIPLFPFSVLVLSCFKSYSAQFMQIRRAANVLFDTTT